MITAVVTSQLHEPDARAHEDVEVFRMRLHVRYCLDGAGTGAYNGDAVVLPLFGLVVVGPAGCVHDFALESVKARDLGPLEVVKDLCASAFATAESIAEVSEGAYPCTMKQ